MRTQREIISELKFVTERRNRLSGETSKEVYGAWIQALRWVLEGDY